MKFLATPSDIESQLRRLLRSSARLRIAVAWAGHDFPLAKLLLEHRSKIEQLTVGIHFYQTHPDFIASFMGLDKARFVMNPDGVFHPKLYYFEHGNGDWECVTGSPNFTNAAFSQNTEVAVLFGSEDVGAAATRETILAALSRFHDQGHRLSEKELDSYRSAWRQQQRRHLQPLAGTYAESNPKRSPLAVPLFVAGWPEYFDSVKTDANHTTEGRLAVLEEARRLFSAHPRFADMDGDARRGIAGFGKSAQFEWIWFGSMKGAGYFKHAINVNSLEVSAALDEIPLVGEVTEDHFDRFRALFRAAFQGSGLATATRLLAMKRPDYFVCLDSKNRDGLCKAFGISKNVSLDNYWPKIVARIIDSAWWNAPEPPEGIERRIWRCRAAFLDVRFYEPGST